MEEVNISNEYLYFEILVYNICLKLVGEVNELLSEMIKKVHLLSEN